MLIQKTKENQLLHHRLTVKNLPFISYSEKALKSIMESDGTIIFTQGSLANGSLLAMKLAKKYHRPCLHINLNLMPGYLLAGMVANWILINRINRLCLTVSRIKSNDKLFIKMKNFIDEVYHVFLDEFCLPDSKSRNIKIEITDPSTIENSGNVIYMETSLNKKLTNSKN